MGYGLLYKVAQVAARKGQAEEAENERKRQGLLEQGQDQVAMGQSAGPGLVPSYQAQGMEGGGLPEQVGGLGILDVYEGGKYSPSEFIQNAKGKIFDAASGAMKGSSKSDTLAGGASGDSLAGGAQGNPDQAKGGGLHQREVDEPGMFEDFLSHRLTGETVGARRERQQKAYVRDAADFLSENPDLAGNPEAAYQSYRQAGGKLGPAMFEDLARGMKERRQSGQEADTRHAEFGRALDYNSAMRNYFASGEDPKHLVPFANKYLSDAFGGSLESLERTDSGMKARIKRKDGQVVDQDIPMSQFRTFVGGDKAVDQQLARNIREIQTTAYGKYMQGGIPKDLAWKMAFGEDVPAQREIKPIGYDARGVPVYDQDKIPAGGLFGEQLKHREPKDPKDRRLVDLPDGGKGFLNEDGSVEPIPATRPGPKQPTVAERMQGIRAVLGKYSGSASLPEIGSGGLADILALAKHSSYQQLVKAAEDKKNTQAQKDLQWLDAAMEELMSESRSKAPGWKAYQ